MVDGEASLIESPAGEMKLVGGRLCLDFTNTVGGRRGGLAGGTRTAALVLRDKLESYADLVAWGLHTGLLTGAEAQRLLREGKRRRAEASAVYERAIALREAIYRICRAVMGEGTPGDADLETLNREVREARGHERLARKVGGFAWEWVDTWQALDHLLWPVARSAAEFLTAGDLSRLRACGGEDCGWLFEDASKNRSRQWCDMQDCGNRAKVRRFRARAGVARATSSRNGRR